MRALSRRLRPEIIDDEPVEVGDYTVDPTEKAVRSCDGELVHLTKTEWDLLAHPGRYTVKVTATNSSGGWASRTTPVIVRHGIVTTYKTVTKYGWEGNPATRGSCFATENYDEDTMELDCWGGKFARSTYNFAIPRNATRITWSTGGRLASADICCKGKVKRTGKRVRPTLFQVRVQVNGWRAFDVRRARVDYELRVMR